jgi:hypothetical protein
MSKQSFSALGSTEQKSTQETIKLLKDELIKERKRNMELERELVLA